MSDSEMLGGLSDMTFLQTTMNKGWANDKGVRVRARTLFLMLLSDKEYHSMRVLPFPTFKIALQQS
jgi:hypothetical protein